MNIVKKVKKGISGFTLVEVLIVVAIVAILVAIALPNYNSSVRKTRRADAQSTLMEFAGTAERVYTTTNPNSYATTALPAASDYYTFSFPVAITATTYSIRATPKTGQSADPCGTMTLTHTGQKTQSPVHASCTWR